MLESIAAIATALTTIVGLYFYIKRKVAAKSAQSYADKESSLAAKINIASSDDERRKYAIELEKLRSTRGH